MDVVACMPVAQCEKIPVRGSVQANCTLCLVPVWVAPTSQKLVEAGKAQVQCLLCAMANMGKDDEFAIAPGAVEELREHLQENDHGNS